MPRRRTRLIVKSTLTGVRHQVYAIAFYTGIDLPFDERVYYYVTERGLVGLASQKSSEVTIIDSCIGKHFKFEAMSDGRGYIVYSGFFANIDHLSRVLDIDSKSIMEFESERAKVEFSSIIIKYLRMKFLRNKI